MFFQKKVKFMRPREATDDWFNIMLLHQNRVAHSPKNFIPEQMLENFLDLIIWGHEHECKIVPAPCSDRDFYITQPGSSIATSLSEYEAKKKHVGLLEVVGSDFRLKPIPLTTVRPFIIDEVVLSEALGDSTDLENENEAVMDLLTKKVNEMIAKAEEETRGSPAPKQPLIRLKVEYAGYETINPQRFGQRFVGKVANPNDILLFYRKKTTNLRAFKDKQEEEDAAEEMLRRATAASRPDALDEQKMEDLITQFLGPTTSLDLLPEIEFNDALYKFVEKDEKNAIADFVAKKLSDAQSYLGKTDTSFDKVEDVQSMVQEMSKRTTTLKAINNNSSQQNGGASLNSDAMDVDKPATSSTKTPTSKSKASSSKSASKSAAPTKQTPLTATLSPTVQTTLTSFAAPKSAPTVGKKRSRVSALEIFGGATKDEDDEGPPKKKIKIKKEKDGNGDIVDSEGEDTSPPKPNTLAKSSSSSSKSSKKNNNDSDDAGSDDDDSGLPLLNTSISSPTPRNWGPRKKTT
jgi:double-strand break repair protein MRE11